MTGSSTKSGSPESLARRLTRGAMWSALMGAAVLGVLLAAALLTRTAVAADWNPPPTECMTEVVPVAPDTSAQRVPAWAVRGPALIEARPGWPSATIIDVVPLAPDRGRVTMLAES